MANFTTNGVGFVNNSVPLLPPTDATRTAMIHSSVYSYVLSAAFTAAPAGSYQLYAYAWEDNNPETFSLALNSQPVLSDYNSGPAGTWIRLGPYPVTLAVPDQVELTSTGGAANLSGLELWQKTSGAAGNRIIAANLPVQSSKTQPVLLYPNPTHDGRFGLALPEAFEDGASYTLFSTLGSKLATGEITAAQAKSDIQLNYSRQMSASGVYYLHVQGKKQSVYLKLLRE